MKNFVTKHKIPIIFYLSIIFLANLPLLIGIDLMKWDIYDAHYPLATYMGDALKSGQLPLWNPMSRYGSPHYAMAGTPVWYPITLILSLIGYVPWMMGFEYSIHRTLAGFGMFLLIKEHTKERGELSVIVGIISGCIYAFSTIFVSNAQHIMIVISATWIPYVILYLKKYIIKNESIYLLISGGFAGLIMLGGYPEIFAGLFLCLIPYIFYEYKLINSDFNKSFILSIKSFVKLCVCTLSASSITVIPFIFSLNNITRGGNTNIQPAETSIKNFLTAIVPGISNQFNFVGDISMIYYYFGLITIVLLVVLLLLKKKESYFYLMIALFAFSMSLGTSFIIYPLFHKYVPLFNSFRFPTVWRCLVVVFVLISISKVWFDLDKEDCILCTIKVVKFFLLSIFIISILILITQHLYPELKYNGILFVKRTSVSLILLSGYIPILLNLKKRTIPLKKGLSCILLVLMIEVLTFQYFEFPTTIGCDLNNVEDGTEYIYNANLQYMNRTKEMDFSNSIRSNTHYHSTRDIIFNRNLDEDGYYSFKLTNTEDYRSSINRTIKTQNPIAYYTNDIVTNKKIELDKWLNLQGISNKQIHLNTDIDNIYIDEIKDNSFDSEVVLKDNLKYDKINGIYIISNNQIFSSNENYRKLILDVDNSVNFKANIRFKSNEGVIVSESEGIFENNDREIELYFPSGKDIITEIEIESRDNINIKNVLYLEGKRATKDKYISIDEFKLNNIVMNTDIQKSGIIVLQQAYYPGWDVYVDNNKSEILLVDGVFMGVALEPGAHEINFRFRPKDFFVGAVISLGYLCIMIFVFLKWKKKKS